MYANSWTELISTKGLRKTNSKGKVSLRLSLRRWGISSRIDTILTNQEETSLGNQDLPILRQLMLCSKSRCAKCWKRLRMSRSSNGQIRWQETPWGTIRAFIANITRTKNILQKNVEICGTIWTSWSERESWSSFCIIPVVRGARQVQNPGEMLLQDLL